MADTTNDIWNDNDGEEDEAPRKGGRLRRFGIFFLVLAAVRSPRSRMPGMSSGVNLPSAAYSTVPVMARTMLYKKPLAQTFNSSRSPFRVTSQ